MYRLFFRRRMSAKVDIVYYLVQFTGIAAVLEVIFSFGIALGGSRLADYASNQLELGKNHAARRQRFRDRVLVYGVLDRDRAVRLLDSPPAITRPLFWQVHRFHHAAPELNFITATDSSAGTFLRAFEFLSPMIFLKVPDSVLLVAVVAGNFINFCQHSELPWTGAGSGAGFSAARGFTSCIIRSTRNTATSISAIARSGTTCSAPGMMVRKCRPAYGIPDNAYEEQPFRQFLRDGWILYMRLGAFLLQPVRKAISWIRPPASGEASLAEGVATTPVAGSQKSGM